jgi:hypothetical protein
VSVVRLSAFVCVQNQDALLAACLRKLSFCDEIVVVADRCTDRSQEIARRHGAKVIDGIFPLESQRKTVGAEACTGDWVLEVEAEDLVDAALAWEIRWVLQTKPAGDWFDLVVDNYVGETRVRDGWAGPLSARSEARLYKRGLKSWAPRRLNPHAVLAGRSGGAQNGAVRRIVGRDVGDLMDRLTRITALNAEDLVDAGQRGRIALGMVRGAGAFLTAYIGRGGWREGRLGLLVALLSGLFPVLSQMRANDVMAARAMAQAAAARPSAVREVVGLAR